MSQILLVFAIDFTKAISEESLKKGLFSKHLMMMMYAINSYDSSLNWSNLLSERREIANNTSGHEDYLFEIYLLCLLIKTETINSKGFHNSLEVASLIDTDRTWLGIPNTCILHLTAGCLTQFLNDVFETQILNPVEHVSTAHRCKILDVFHVIEKLRRLMLFHGLSTMNLDTLLFTRHTQLEKTTIIEYDYLLSLLIKVRIEVMLAVQFDTENEFVTMLSHYAVRTPYELPEYLDSYNQQIELISEWNHEEPLLELLAVRPKLFQISDFPKIVQKFPDRSVFSHFLLRDYLLFCIEKSSNVFESYNYLVFFLVTSAASKQWGEEEQNYFDFVISQEAPKNFVTFEEYNEHHQSFNAALQAIINARHFLSDQNFGKILCTLFQKWPTIFNYRLLVDLYLKTESLPETDTQTLVQIVRSISEKSTLSYFASYVVSTALDNTPSQVLKTTLFPEEISIESMKAKLHLLIEETNKKLKLEEDQSNILEHFSNLVYILQFLKSSETPLGKVLQNLLRANTHELLLEIFLSDVHTNIHLDFDRQTIWMAFFFDISYSKTPIIKSLSSNEQLDLYDLQYILAYKNFAQHDSFECFNRKYCYRPLGFPRKGLLILRLEKSLRILIQEGLLALDALSDKQYFTLLAFTRQSYIAGVEHPSKEISCLIKVIYRLLNTPGNQSKMINRLENIILNLKNFYKGNLSLIRMIEPIETLIKCWSEFLISGKVPKKDVLTEIQRKLKNPKIICSEKQLLINKLDGKIFDGEIYSEKKEEKQHLLPQRTTKTKRTKKFSSHQEPVASPSIPSLKNEPKEESLDQLYERLNIATGDELTRTLEIIMKKLSTTDYESFTKNLPVNNENSLSTLKVILKSTESWNEDDRDHLLYYIVLTNKCLNTRLRAHKCMKTSLAQDSEILSKIFSVDSEANIMAHPRQKLDNVFSNQLNKQKDKEVVFIRAGDINKYAAEIDWSEIKLSYEGIIKHLIDKAKLFGFTLLQKDDKPHSKWSLIDNEDKDYGSIIIDSHGHHLDKIKAQIRYKEVYAFICIARDKKRA